MHTWLGFKQQLMGIPISMLESKTTRTKRKEQKEKKKKKRETSQQALLELGAFEVLLQLEAGEGLWLAGVLLEVLPVLSLLALPQLQGKLQLEGRGEGGQHSRVQLIQPLWQNCLRGSMISVSSFAKKGFHVNMWLSPGIYMTYGFHVNKTRARGKE